MIEDTSFLIDILDGDPDANTMLELAERENRPEKVSAITYLELYGGVRRADKPEAERRAVLDVLDTKRVVPADQRILTRAGELSGDLFADGTPIDREDCTVAATAVQEDEPVVTRNADHFHRIAELDVETY